MVNLTSVARLLEFTYITFVTPSNSFSINRDNALSIFIFHFFSLLYSILFYIFISDTSRSISLERTIFFFFFFKKIARFS